MEQRIRVARESRPVRGLYMSRRRKRRSGKWTKRRAWRLRRGRLWEWLRVLEEMITTSHGHVVRLQESVKGYKIFDRGFDGGE